MLEKVNKQTVLDSLQSFKTAFVLMLIHSNSMLISSLMRVKYLNGKHLGFQPYLLSPLYANWYQTLIRSLHGECSGHHVLIPHWPFDPNPWHWYCSSVAGWIAAHGSNRPGFSFSLRALKGWFEPRVTQAETAVYLCFSQAPGGLSQASGGCHNPNRCLLLHLTSVSTLG